MEPFIGQIQQLGFSFPPKGWALCDGSLIEISQNEVLFSLIGTIYGGDGRNNFALPDLRGYAPIHFGQGPGLTNHALGNKGGEEEVTLELNQMPGHTHQAAVSSEYPDTSKPSNASIGSPQPSIYKSAFEAGTTPLSNSTVGDTGGNQPHDNMQPYVTVNWCIALEGIYPTRD